jgi:hypothetical protein
MSVAQKAAVQVALFEGPRKSKVHPAELKSAFQKHLRRTEVQKALATAAGMVSHGTEERIALCKRIPIICVEDLGWEFMPRVYAEAKTWPMMKTAGPMRPEQMKGLYSLIANLATLPKSKEAGWLYTIADENLKTTKWYSVTGLEKALDAKDYIEASRICMAAHRAKEFLARHGLVRVITTRAEATNPWTQQIVEGCLWRLVRKCMLGDEEMLICAIVMALIDQPKQEPIPWPGIVVEPGDIEMADTVDWYGLDLHTYRGKNALSKVGTERNIDPFKMGMLMFFFESALLLPNERPIRWRNEALDICAKQFGWNTDDEGAKLWDEVKGDVRKYIEESLKNAKDWSK